MVLADAVRPSELVDALFSESSGRMVLEVVPEHVDEVCANTGGVVVAHLTDEERFVCRSGDRAVFDVGLDDLLFSWRGHVVDSNTGEGR